MSGPRARAAEPAAPLAPRSRHGQAGAPVCVCVRVRACVFVQVQFAYVAPNAIAPLALGPAHYDRSQICAKQHKQVAHEQKKKKNKSRSSRAGCNRGHRRRRRPALQRAPQPARQGLPAGSPAHAIEVVSADPAHRPRLHSVRLQHVRTCSPDRVWHSRAGTVPLSQRVRDRHPVAQRGGMVGRLRRGHATSRSRCQVLPALTP